MIQIINNYIDSPYFIIILLAFFLSVSLAISLHEFAHAFVAYKCGDNTPKYKGRLTINIFKHLDLVGTICLFLFGFGWAKPVEINPYNFKSYRKDLLKTSTAGIITNLILFTLSFLGLAIVFSSFDIVYYIESSITLSAFIEYLVVFLFFFFSFFSQINLALFLFNLMPVYPLDGFNIVDVSLKNSTTFRQVSSRYSFIFLIMALVFINKFYPIIYDLAYTPLLSYFYKIIQVF